MQHVYAFIFAGSITTLVAAFILYVDYGFWHEKYTRSEVSEETSYRSNNEEHSVESPSQTLSRFISDAKVQLQSISSSKEGLLEGKEVYIKE